MAESGYGEAGHCGPASQLEAEDLPISSENLSRREFIKFPPAHL
jgi:hypothetical protein